MAWAVVRPDALAVLRDQKARAALARYFDVFVDRKPAKFLIGRRLPAAFGPEDSASRLWSLHNQLLDEYYRVERDIDEGKRGLEELGRPERSFFDLKVEIARRILRSCCFCERRCGADRSSNQLGWCQAGSEMLVSSMFEHMGEEPELVPSGTVFTISCNFRCLHCQNWSISQRFETGEIYAPDRLAKAVEGLRRLGCRNINMVGGDPTVWLHHWLEVFKRVGVNVPALWNSNAYYSEESAKLLGGFIDVYKLDFKYGNDSCAERISGVKRYWEVCTRNHVLAKRLGELIIRVLVLPNHLECCCKPILNWIVEKLGRETRVNVMWQYRPEWRAHELPELRRRLTRAEMDRSIEIAHEAGLTNFVT